KIKVRLEGTDLIENSVGRLVFNKVVPKELGFRNDNFDKKKLQGLVREAHRALGNERTAELIDEIKRTGFYYMKQSGLSWGMDDLLVPSNKYDMIKGADEEVESTYGQFKEGLLTEEERKN